MGRCAHLGESGAEAVEHLLHVASFLHADDTQVILFVHPHQESLVVVVPAGESEGLKQHEVQFIVQSDW